MMEHIRNATLTDIDSSVSHLKTHVRKSTLCQAVSPPPRFARACLGVAFARIWL